MTKVYLCTEIKNNLASFFLDDISGLVGVGYLFDSLEAAKKYSDAEVIELDVLA